MSDVLERPATDARTEALRHAHTALKEARYADIAAHSRPFAGHGDVEHAVLLGVSIAFDGQVEEAADLFAYVAGERPNILHPVDDLARMMREAGRDLEALPHAEAAVARRPDDVRALVVLGALLCLDFRPVEAERVLRRAVALKPDDANLWNHLGIALIEQGRHDDSIDAFRRSTEVEPNGNAGWTNLACSLATEGQFDEALAHYRRSIMLKPDMPGIRVNHAIGLLKAGRMVQGWTEYEWRLKTPGHTTLPDDRLIPNLARDTRLDGKTVMVTHEEGLGDTLQCMRHLAKLADRGARVKAWVPETLVKLVGRVPGVEAFSGEGHDVGFTLHAPFLSLPRAFAATDEALPTDPYIFADPAKVVTMAAHLPPDDRLRVGLVWGGDPRLHIRAANAVDRKRSMGVGPLAALRSVGRAVFVSLQYGPHREAIRDLPPEIEIHDPMDAVRDMDDTAAIIANLDVVVSVDTSIVHLAAGLGAPTILLDRYDNCWRWLYGRDDSPYYPTLRIIRQTRAFDWDGVAARLAVALQVMADAKARGRTPSVHAAINAVTPYPITIPT